MQDELEEAGELNEEEIEERVDELRKKLTAELESGGGGAGPVGGRGREGAGGRREFKTYEVHEMAAQKEMETERLRRALGIGKDYEEGSHWRRQEEERERKLRNAADGEDGEVRDRRNDRGGYRDSRDSREGRDGRDGGRRSEGGRRRSRSASPER